MKIFILAFISIVALSACSDPKDWGLFSDNPKKTPYTPPAEGEKVTNIGEISKESFRPALDILFVIDDSASMDAHQRNLSSNITLFTDAIVKTKFLDYHIGVITSSMYDYSSYSYYGYTVAPCCGQLVGTPAFVERNTPNGIPALAKNLLVGTGGDSSEAFFDPVVAAFTPPMSTGANVGFLRQDAYLAIIFITDTDDQSSGTNTPQAFLNFLNTVKGSPDKLFIGAAFIPDAEVNTCTGESYEIAQYDRLPAFFRLTNSMTFSLCDPLFGQKLAEIGKLLASKAQTMYLKQFPKAGTITVTIGTELMPNDAKKGWTYNPERNALEFGSEIEWDKYPDNTYPVVDFESIPVE